MKCLPYLLFLGLLLVAGSTIAGTTLEDVQRAEKAAREAMKVAVQTAKDADPSARKQAWDEYIKLFQRQRDLEQKYFAENPTRSKGA